jgi:hypothetical protein
MAASSPSSRRNGNSRIKAVNLILTLCVSVIVLLTAPFHPPIGVGGIGFASAFTTAVKTTSSRPSNGKSTTQREASDGTTTTEDGNIWTLQQLEDYALDETINVVISFTTFGPGYRAVARAKHDESIVLGYVEGFLRPTQPKLLHLDKMEIFQPVLERVRRTHPNTLNFGGVNIGLGLVMGYRCLLYAAEKKRTIAEFLAIDDEDFQHKRLVRYYRYAGFKVVKYVGDDAKDIPDRLVWGGCGTLMKQDIPVMMAKWTSLFEMMKSRVEKETETKRAKLTASESDQDGTK